MSPGIGVGVGLPFVHLQRRASGFSPASLFSSGEEGAWYDPSDLSTLWQDAAGTTPVTAADQPVGRIDDKSGNGNHATQSTAGSRPLYKTAGGLHWLQFDGIDDELSKSATFASGDRSVAAAIETLGAGLGTNVNQVAGWHNASGLYLGFSSSPNGVYRVNDVGGPTSAQVRTSASATQPFIGVGAFGTAAFAEVNGGSLTATQGALSRTPNEIKFAGPVGNIGNRKVFGLVLVGRTFTTDERDSLRTYLAEKSGVTL